MLMCQGEEVWYIHVIQVHPQTQRLVHVRGPPGLRHHHLLLLVKDCLPVFREDLLRACERLDKSQYEIGDIT